MDTANTQTPNMGGEEDDDSNSLFEGDFDLDTLVAADDADILVTDDDLTAELAATPLVDDQGPSEIGHPDADDPYWGVNSNMYGIARALNKNGCWVSILDKRYKDHKRLPNAVGHNGNGPGAWFPIQPIALFCGAHGAMQGGVYGNAEGGAYSIVLSSEYAKVNYEEDDGNTIFYAAKESKEHAKDDELPPESQYTRYLRTSKENKQPVRVLRSSYIGMPGYFKFRGLRYDGLYMIVEILPKLNKWGGKCTYFKLKRINEDSPKEWQKPEWKQRALEKCLTRPTAKDKSDFKMAYKTAKTWAKE